MRYLSTTLQLSFMHLTMKRMGSLEHYMCSIFDWMVYVCGSMATTKSENIHQCNMSQTCQETDFLPNGYQNVLVVIWALLHTELLLLLVYISMTSVFKIQGQGSSGSRNCILISKLFWPTVRQNCSSDREKLLKFEAEDRGFSKFL